MATTNQWHWNQQDSYGIVAQEIGEAVPVEYEIHDPEPSSITLNTGGRNSEEMIRIAPDGFYVRGVKVPVDEHEAQAVFKAFQQWLTWAQLNRV